MNFEANTYISSQDLLFQGVLNDIKKSRTALQPIFEGFTNALEAIRIKSKTEEFAGRIDIEIKAVETTIDSTEFLSLTIIDNGVGFDDVEFKRFNTYKDFTKGYKNLGSGRIQYAHYFDQTNFRSVFKSDGKFYIRKFIVSQNQNFLKHNAIVLHKLTEETTEKETGTIVQFLNILEHSPIYNSLNEQTLKQALLSRYIHYFCHHKSNLPKISIKFYVQNNLKSESSIEIQDIPNIDKYDSVDVKFSRLAKDGKSIEHTDRLSTFYIDAFKIDKSIIKSNELRLISKGELVEETEIDLLNLAENDSINGSKFLFLVSSEYIDKKDTNLRGMLDIPDKESFSKKTSLFTQEEIFIEDIQGGVNDKINSMYPEINKIKELHDDQVNRLKEMFLLDEETAKKISISVNDSESKILEKFYEVEAKKTAKLDAEIKTSFDRLNLLDTRSEEYNEEFKEELNKLVQTIPQQNKNALTQYVARRKLVLELFDKILKRELDVQLKSKSNYDEAIIHNLLFQQGSDDPNNSDLWILNEDFIYFRGSSEKRLSKLMLDGKPAFKDIFTEEEEKYLTSFGENRRIKRPDVLLFPEEGKCIIIELKSPEVNASEHLTQIDFYANLIRNYTRDDLQIKTFYGYLIGENIEPRDVLGRVSRYEHSYQLDYLYRPSENVIGFDERSNGSIYTEVIKYSTLLERALRRNKVFISKLDKAKNSNI